MRVSGACESATKAKHETTPNLESLKRQLEVYIVGVINELCAWLSLNGATKMRVSEMLQSVWMRHVVRIVK